MQNFSTHFAENILERIEAFSVSARFLIFDYCFCDSYDYAECLFGTETTFGY